MKTYYTAVVIGGGASGLYFSHLMKDCLLIEKKTGCASKLLMTGGGECNFTHDDDAAEMVRHYYEKKAFVSPAIYSHDSHAIRSHFEELGVPSFTREDGKVFPLSRDAHSVAYALINNTRNIITACRVTGVRKENGIFITQSTKGEFTSKYLVIAAGGASCPATGSDGDGYALASSFGHHIITPGPGLCRIKLVNNIPGCEGITLENVSFRLAGKTFEGPLLFTDNGISGPAVMNASRYVENKDEITICFHPLEENAVKRLEGRKKAVNALSAYTHLPDRFLRNLLPFLGDKNIADMNRQDIRETVQRLSAFRSSCTTQGEMKRATVTHGGVDTKKVDRKTFQSLLCDNLHLIGEVLDVDGECGGYNLSFAFASAFCAFSAISEKES